MEKPTKEEEASEGNYQSEGVVEEEPKWVAIVVVGLHPSPPDGRMVAGEEEVIQEAYTSCLTLQTLEEAWEVHQQAEQHTLSRSKQILLILQSLVFI